MFRKILLACSNAELREFLFDAIKDLTDAQENPSDNIREARDAAAVRSILKEVDCSEGRGGLAFDLAVIELHLRIEHRSAPDRSREIGLELVRELHEARLGTASILLANTLEPRLLNACQSLPRCKLLIASDDLRSGLEAALKGLAAPTQATAGNDGALAAREQLAVATIEIDLPSEQYMTYRMNARSNTLEWNRDQRFLELPGERLRELVEDSRILHNNEDWQVILRQIGRQLCDIINRGRFALDLREARGWCGGSLKNVHIRFTVPPELHGLAFEALYDRDGGEDGYGYLMLNAPVARRVRELRKSRQLCLESDRPINILFIEANVGGVTEFSGPDDQELRNFLQQNQLGSLDNVAQERDYFGGLRSRLDGSSRPRQSIGKITFLPNEGTSGGDLADAIKNELTGEGKPIYDIVHFAGHSIFVSGSGGGNGRSYLILPGAPYPEPLPIGEFADWLGEAGTQFVYLSSCRSSEADAAYELAGNGVPAVVGFRWDIEDKLAAEYAREFYEQLFECAAFDEAFLRTRRFMFHRYYSNRIWAAPMLILQPKDWHRYCRSVIASPDYYEPPRAA